MSQKLTLAQTRQSKNSRGKGAIWIPHDEAPNRGGQNSIEVKIEPGFGDGFEYRVKGSKVPRQRGEAGDARQARTEVKRYLEQIASEYLEGDDFTVDFDMSVVAGR